ncbi:hypothetical protein Moror_5112 [Moniliophthora roreri MCA 2997]|uniref:Uncharacterized protein n=1 Tax=Moniliophthora roreri (strain MCA 2997) TaxID=1381753 RepID=V2WJH3_MONRO|nr:hypothetical protein Moror_5112 [Moniliophthora roreri MCA 2997]
MHDAYHEEVQVQLVELGLGNEDGSITQDILDNPINIHNAMSTYIDWYTKAHADHIRYLKEDGKYQTILNCVLRSFMKLATTTRDNHDIYVFGFALDTTHDTQGKTLNCMWGTPEMLEIQDQYAPNIKEKIADLEAMLRYSSFRCIHKQYVDGKHCRVKLVCKEAVAVGSFVKQAGALQIHLLNWPDNVPFPAKEEWIQKLVDGSLSKKEQQELTVICFKHWTADERALPADNQQWIPIVQSSNSSDLGYACNSEDWLKKHDIDEQDIDEAGTEQAQEKGKACAVEQAKKGGEEESQSPILLKGPSKHTLPAAPPSSSPHKAP